MPEFDQKTLLHKTKTQIPKTPKPQKHYSKSLISEDHIDENIMEEVEPKVTFLELFTRSLIASAITAVGIATAFFPPTAPFAIFIIPVALTLSAAIVKTPAQHYVNQNPNGFIANFFRVMTGVRAKGKQVSQKLFRDENALEAVVIETVASASKNKGVKKTAEGVSASRVMSGEGSKQEQAAFKKQQNKFNKDVASSIQTKLVSNNNKEKIVKIGTKEAVKQITKNNKNKTTSVKTAPKQQKTNASTSKESVKPLGKSSSKTTAPKQQTEKHINESVKTIKSSKINKKQLKLIKEILNKKTKNVSSNPERKISKGPTPSAPNQELIGRSPK